ncbi:MAG: hypothetical protein K6B72_03155 [Lachnospiraceae bacterium]|nr:hypothetical protein [Lachnospiraceae bacterium]
MGNRMEEELLRAGRSEEAMSGSDALSGMIDAYAIPGEEDLSREELLSVTGGRQDPGDRIWQRILEKSGNLEE